MIILVLVKSTASKLGNRGSQYFHKTDFRFRKEKKNTKKIKPQNIYETIPEVLK